MDSQHLREIADVLEKCATDNQPGSLMAHAAKLHALADDQDKAQQEYPSGMLFEAALYAIKNGNRVARACWDRGLGFFVAIHHPPLLAGHEKMTAPNLYKGDAVGCYPLDAES